MYSSVPCWCVYMYSSVPCWCVYMYSSVPCWCVYMYSSVPCWCVYMYSSVPCWCVYMYSSVPCWCVYMLCRIHNLFPLGPGCSITQYWTSQKCQRKGQNDKSLFSSSDVTCCPANTAHTIIGTRSSLSVNGVYVHRFCLLFCCLLCLFSYNS